MDVSGESDRGRLAGEVEVSVSDAWSGSGGGAADGHAPAVAIWVRGERHSSLAR